MSKTIDIKNLKPAKRYAQAILGLNDVAGLIAQLEDIEEILKKNSELKNFIEHPIIGAADKKDVIKQLMEGKVRPDALNFLYVLIEEDRINIFQTIVQCLKEEYSTQKGIVRATVTSVIEFDSGEKERLKKVLEEKLHAQTELSFELDSSLIGGFCVNVQDRIIDLSVKSKFEQLKKLNKG